MIKDGGTTVANRRKNADLRRDANYLRPKWGVYRGLEISGPKNTYQLIRNDKGYQLQ
ncbi:MAG TPA: hypothetical protein VJT49_15525 [Amycolatopsis sp.]|uniref:hypothetical protein n=1 Tax=Amycolatopsis sp. TaxID=37632 RepID=UPI002B487DDA|nr:hypothetical protein [Amycolatopsis sp.]HKS46488.1 hypothetical protein [Amycolatopsis sp.]